ncbi:glycoside hydrolase family 5 protein [Plantactinospora solaniradicis]|uniref:Glycoside hydrolase family 5 protein n=1 Tax=Plantactinospora solaniradicis TaxID=1723736 RepID=A0ABW1K689_9ACTN
MEKLPWIRVDGDRLVDATGTVVTLAGVGLGGWLNMENFITGYPGTESQQRRALHAALGDEGYQRFFTRFLTDFFAAEDAGYLASLGFNSVRVPFSYRHFEDDDRPFVLKPEGFHWLDRVVEQCADAGLYTILDLHAVPGHQNQNWHSDNPTHWAHFWTHRHFQDRVVHLWEAIAQRYRDNPAVAGYNPVNEPADPSGEVIGPFYERLVGAIREVDSRHVLVPGRQPLLDRLFDVHRALPRHGLHRARLRAARDRRRQRVSGDHPGRVLRQGGGRTACAT